MTLQGSLQCVASITSRLCSWTIYLIPCSKGTGTESSSTLRSSSLRVRTAWFVRTQSAVQLSKTGIYILTKEEGSLVNAIAAVQRFVLSAVGGGINHSNAHRMPCLIAVDAGKHSFPESPVSTIPFGKMTDFCFNGRPNC